MRHRLTYTYCGSRADCGIHPQYPVTRIIAVVVLLALALSLVSCSAAGTGEAAADGGRTAPEGFPVTVTNCGVTTTYQRPPQAVVAVGQQAIVNMLALGLADRMIGIAFLPDSVPAEYRDAYRQVPVLTEQYPAYEVLLKAAPDFVYGGHENAFSKQEGRSRKRLRGAGIKTYLNVTNCTDEAVTLETVWHELRTLATIFGVEQRAQELIEELKGEVASVKRKLDGVKPVSVFVYDHGTKTPFTVGGNGIANEIIRLAGGRNVFVGTSKDWLNVSWEQVIQRRPEWIVLMDYGSTSVKQKKQTLLSNPVLADVPAIKHRRFVVVPLASMLTGVRVPHTANRLARQLHPGQFQ